MSVIRYSQSVIDAAVACYGKRSASLVAADLGVSTGAISHWWAKAKQDGRVAPLFDRHSGGAVLAGRVSRSAGGEERVEAEIPRRFTIAQKKARVTAQTVVAAIRDAGTTGLCMDELSQIVNGRSVANEVDRRAVHRVLDSAARMLRIEQQAITSTVPGRAYTRYVIAEASHPKAYGSKRHKEPRAEVIPADPALTPIRTTVTFRSVSRKVDGFLGLGATPGTLVSVPWVSFLDAEAAAQGGGAAG